MRIEEVRKGLAARLRQRRPEIERAAVTRVRAVSDPRETSDPEYMEGLTNAIAKALDYGIAALEHSNDSTPQIPPTLLAQARLAARSKVSLDTVLRRYLAGYTLLGDFVVEEAERDGLLGTASLRASLRAQGRLFDRLLAAVSEEYEREAADRFRSPDQRRADRVRRLLAGELLDLSEFTYDFGGWHLGLVAAGPRAGAALRALAEKFGVQPLLVRCGENSRWAWFGSRHQIDPEEVRLLVNAEVLPCAIGEPSEGLDGWRLTHEQARTAMPIAARSPGRCVRYAEVALLASVLQDDLLTSSLRQRYLDPLHRAPDDAVLLETLRGYFSAERNVSSAAAALGVNRQTVAKRLRSIEERLGCDLGRCATEVDVALRLDQLTCLPTVTQSVTSNERTPTSRRGKRGHKVMIS